MAIATGLNTAGQCNIPALVGASAYTDMATGGYHTVLLRDNGTAVACGMNSDGQCDIPALSAGLTYTQVAAAAHIACGQLLGHSVLLRSDGMAVACGCNQKGP